MEQTPKEGCCKHGLMKGTCAYCSGLVRTPSLAGVSRRDLINRFGEEEDAECRSPK